MAEPGTAALTTSTAAGIGLASLFPGIDGNALIGAFAGATLFVISARELPHWMRALYLLISLVMGYIAAPEITSHTFISQSGVAGFVGGLLCISVAQPLVRKLETTDILSLLKGAKK